MRLACVFVPQLALQAALRRNPEARGAAAALFDRPAAAPRAKVVAVTGEARRAGVRAGMTLAQAEAVCPAVRPLTVSAADRATARAALADVGYAFAPRIDIDAASGQGNDGDGDGDGRIFFDVGDLQRLYPSGEAAVTQAIQSRAARVGLGVRVAIASSKGVARVATRARELAVVPVARDGARAFLAPLPIAALVQEADAEDDGARGPSPALAAFRRWGVATVGALAALPPAEVALRLGPAGARLCRLAGGGGDDDDPFAPRLPADAVEEGTTLDYAIYEIEPLAFVLRGMLDRALERLACRSLACAGITLRLTLDPRGLDVREIPIAAPTREPATLLALVRLDLARRPPPAGVVGAALSALPARVRSSQLDFLRPTGPAPDRLAATIARLASLVGPENVGIPHAEDTWREEAVEIRSHSPSSSSSSSSSSSQRPLGIRRFRPAREIEVLIGREGPIALHGADTTARVLVAAGPYRINGEWWRPSDPNGSNEPNGPSGQPEPNGQPGGFSRDYWDVHASDGAVYRLHHDQRSDRWFLDGYYD